MFLFDSIRNIYHTSTLIRSGVCYLKSSCFLLFHWELVDCKPLRGQWLRAQVCEVVNTIWVEICCIGSGGTAGDSQHPTSYLHYLHHRLRRAQREDRATPYHLGIRFSGLLGEQFIPID